MLRKIAFISLVVAAAAIAQTYIPGRGEQPVLGKMRSNFIAGAGPNQKMISVLDLDGTFVKSITQSGSDYLFTFQDVNNVEGTVTISVSGGTGRTEAQIQAIVGGMVTSNSETGGIRIDYDEGTQKLNIASALPDSTAAIRSDMADSLAYVRADIGIPDPSIAEDGRIIEVLDGAYVLAANTGSGGEMPASAIGPEWARTSNLRTGTHNTLVSNIQWTLDSDAPAGSRVQILSQADDLYIVRENLNEAVVGIWLALYADGISTAPDPTRLFVEFSAETTPSDRFLLFTDPSGDAPDEASITFSIIPNRFDPTANKVTTVISIRVTAGTGDVLPNGAYIAVHPAVAAGGGAGNVTQQNLDDAVAPLRTADRTLGDRIDSEESARASADVALGGRIDNEEDARVAADAVFGQRLGNLAAVTAEIFPSEIADIDALEQAFTVAFDPIQGGSLPTGTVSARVNLQGAQHTTVTINENTRYIGINVDNAELTALKNAGTLTNATTHVNFSFLFINASGNVVGTAASSIQINDNNFPQSKRATAASISTSVAAEEARATAALNAMRDALSMVDQNISDEVEAIDERLRNEEIKAIDTPHRGATFPVNPEPGELFYLTQDVITGPTGTHYIESPIDDVSDTYGFVARGGIGPSSLTPNSGARPRNNINLGTGEWLDGDTDGSSIWILDNTSGSPTVRKWSVSPLQRVASGDIPLSTTVQYESVFAGANHIFVISSSSRTISAYNKTTKAINAALGRTLPAGVWRTSVIIGTRAYLFNSTNGDAIVYTISDDVLTRRSDLDLELPTQAWNTAALDPRRGRLYIYESALRKAFNYSFPAKGVYSVAPTRNDNFDLPFDGPSRTSCQGIFINRDIAYCISNSLDQATAWSIPHNAKPPVLGDTRIAGIWIPKPGQTRENRVHVAYDVSWPTGGANINKMIVTYWNAQSYSTQSLEKIGNDISVNSRNYRIFAEREASPIAQAGLSQSSMQVGSFLIQLHFSSIGYAEPDGTFAASMSRQAGDYIGGDDGLWHRWYPPATESSAGISDDDQEKLDRYADNPAANPSTHTGEYELISPYTNIIYAPATAAALSIDAGDIMIGAGAHANSILILLAAIDAEVGSYLSSNLPIILTTASGVTRSGVVNNVNNPSGNKYIIGVSGDFSAMAAYTGNINVSFGSLIAMSLAAAANPPVASREEAIAGTATDPRLWSPEQVKTAVLALAQPVTSDNFGGPHLPNPVYNGQEFLLTVDDITGGAHEHSATFYPVVLGTAVAGHSLVSLRGTGIPYNVLGTPASQLPNFPDVFNAARLVAVLTWQEEERYIFRETGLTVGGVVYTPTHVRYNYRDSSGRARLSLSRNYTIGGVNYRDYGAVGTVVDPGATEFGPWTFSIEFSGDDGSTAFLDTDGSIDNTAPVSFAAGRYVALGHPLSWNYVPDAAYNPAALIEGTQLPIPRRAGQEFLLTARSTIPLAEHLHRVYLSTYLFSGQRNTFGASLIDWTTGASNPINIGIFPPDLGAPFTTGLLVTIYVRQITDVNGTHFRTFFVFNTAGFPSGFTPTLAHIAVGSHEAHTALSETEAFLHSTVSYKIYRTDLHTDTVAPIFQGQVSEVFEYSIRFSNADGSQHRYIGPLGTPVAADVVYEPGRHAVFSDRAPTWARAYVAREPNVLLAWNLDREQDDLTVPANYTLYSELMAVVIGGGKEVTHIFPISALSSNFSGYGVSNTDKVSWNATTRVLTANNATNFRGFVYAVLR